MTALLEFRQKICEAYGKYEFYVRLCGKFLLAFCVFYLVQLQIGDVNRLKDLIPVTVSALISLALPSGALSGLMCLYIVIRMTAISAEAGAITAVFFLLLLLTYFIFKPKYTVLMAVSCLAGLLNISGTAAIPIGLLCGPMSLIPTVAGMVTYGMITTLRQNISVLETSAVRLTSMEKITYFINAVFSNERLFLLIAGAVLTILMVYAIRRLPYSYAWAIAIAAGTACYVLIILIGNVAFGVTVNLYYLSIAIVIGVLISGLLHFFRFLLDGAHAEYLEYEDEAYVYYVKAIPKYSVTRTDKKVTTITEPGESEQSDGFPEDGRSPEDYFRE